MGTFSDIGPLVRWVGPREYRLEEAFSYTDDKNNTWTAPAGMVFDFASIPRLIWNIYPPDGTWANASVIHDALYEYRTTLFKDITREQADDIFLEAMKSSGVPFARRQVMYRAVRAFGGKQWLD